MNTVSHRSKFYMFYVDYVCNWFLSNHVEIRIILVGKRKKITYQTALNKNPTPLQLEPMIHLKSNSFCMRICYMSCFDYLVSFITGKDPSKTFKRKNVMYSSWFKSWPVKDVKNCRSSASKLYLFKWTFFSGYDHAQI